MRTKRMSITMVNRFVLIDLSAEFISSIALAGGKLGSPLLPGTAESL